MPARAGCEAIFGFSADRRHGQTWQSRRDVSAHSASSARNLPSALGRSRLLRRERARSQRSVETDVPPRLHCARPMPSPVDDDYHALLGVHPDADSDELRRAWRQLALRWHPDRAGDVAKATFQRLSAAYTVLSDPIARAAYDRRRHNAEPAGAPRSAAATSRCGSESGALTTVERGSVPLLLYRPVHRRSCSSTQAGSPRLVSAF